MTYTPELADVVEQIVDHQLMGMNTCMPAVIESYDPATRTCSVKPALKRKYENGTLVERPLISDVPVMFNQGGKFSITYPLKRGDDVLLIFSQRSLEQWKGSTGIVDPKDSRKFHLSDAICIPNNPRPSKNVNTADANKTLIQDDKSIIEMSEDGTVVIKNGNGSITLAATGKITCNANGKLMEVDVNGKFKFEGTHNLLEQLILLAQNLQTAQVLTALGPQNILPPALTAFGQIETKLTAIKG